MKLRGANARSKGTGLDRQPGVTNYFLGSDPRAWRRDVPNFDRVEYSGVYEGIDLVYYGKEGRLEFDFHFAPGADPRKPVLQFAGADRVQISSGGELVLDLEGTQVLFHRPEAYQGEPGDRRAVACDYDVARDGTVRFRLGSFDHSLPLVIDPEMTVFTLFGGSESDYGTSVALDPQGNIYVAGETKSADFPTVNAIQDRIGKIQNAIPTDLFIAKLDPEGKHLLSATYLGGSGTDRSARLAVDSAGRVYVAGETHSADFPRTPGSLTMGGPIGESRSMGKAAHCWSARRHTVPPHRQEPSTE